MSAKILAGNWKLHKLRSEAQLFFDSLAKVPETKSSVRKIIAASPTLLESAGQAATPAGVEVFSQNCAWQNQGAWTGELSPLQLLDVGVKGTLIGHSERRQFFGDTDESCQKRAECALQNNLHVIYCIGESLAERKAEQTRSVLEKQLAPVIALRAAGNASSASPFVLAYEPVWAIGTGVVAELAQIIQAHAWIAEILSSAKLPAYPILYGGSVKPSNFKEISSLPHVSGGLVGGASLESNSFLELHRCLV
jgi:triosephosphate isomerase